MSRRWSAVPALLAVLMVISLAGLDPARGDDHRTPPSHGKATLPNALQADARGLGLPSGTASKILGFDGLDYPSAPVVVHGYAGDDFLGLEFDNSCANGGTGFEKGMHRLDQLVKIIRRSGRNVIFTVAPSKSSVVTHSINKRDQPQGSCDSAGRKDQSKLIDSYPDPSYLPVRKTLTKDDRQTYWKTDPHWTSLGGAIYSQLLAWRLGPRIGDHQKYVDSTATEVGLLNQLQDIDTPETAPAVLPSPRIRVKTAPGSDDWLGFPYLVYDHSWISKPRAKTYKGRTLLIGDSFSEYALDTLRPLFHKGRFLWTGQVDPAVMTQAIVDSKNVVIEVYQVGIPNSILGQKAYLQQVKAALGEG